MSRHKTLKIASILGKYDVIVLYIQVFSFTYFDIHPVDLIFMTAFEQAFPGDNDEGIIPCKECGLARFDDFAGTKLF